MVGSEFVWVGTHECSKIKIKKRKQEEEGDGEGKEEKERKEKAPHDDKLATPNKHFFLFTKTYFTLILPTNILNTFWVVIAQLM